MMRVISGYLKGRNILGYNINGTRPTMDRVKESMFASIQSYIDNDTFMLTYGDGVSDVDIKKLADFQKQLVISVLSEYKNYIYLSPLAYTILMEHSTLILENRAIQGL